MAPSEPRRSPACATHQFDAEEAGLRPKAARVEDPVTDQLGRAAAEGRTDVLGAAGMLGLQRAVGNGGGHLDGRGGALAGARRDRLGRPPARARTSAPTWRAGSAHDFGDVRVHDDGAAHDSATGGQRARLHGRLQRRLPARQVRPGLATPAG